MAEGRRELPPAPGSLIARAWKNVWATIPIVFHFLLSPYAVYREFWKRPNKYEEFPNKGGQVAVLTGGTRGIGLEVLKRLLECRFHVIVGCRSLINGEEVVASLRSSGVSTGSAKVFQLDLKSLKSVKKFAESVLKEAPRIDLLINNAGIMFPPYELTEDGYETQFQVNYLSHFLLTNLLLPRMKETGKRSDKTECCRVVNVASDSHYAGHIDFNDLEKCKIYSSGQSYNDSKLCQVLHANYLNKLLASEEVRINCYSLQPGVIPSDLWDNMGLLKNVIMLLKCLFKSTEDGADTIMYAAVSEELEGRGGLYINTGEVAKPSTEAQDVSLQKKLWDKSLQLVGS